MPSLRPLLSILLPMVVLTSVAQAHVHPIEPIDDSPLMASRTYEQQLIDALDGIREQRWDEAMVQLEQLIERNPTFRLAQLVYADLMLARSGVVKGFGGANGEASVVADLRDEALRRWTHHAAPPPNGKIPPYLLELSDNQRNAIVVDQERARLYLLRNEGGRAVLMENSYVSGGRNGMLKEVEGDQRTPIGVYFVLSHIPGSRLPPLYGWGAFPINYPNEWDRRLGRTGFGIWLHGNPDGNFSRPPQDSDGCITMYDRDIEALAEFIQVGHTPVIISERIDWVDPQLVETQRQELRSVIDQWITDWESLDADRYLAHYSPTFSAYGQDHAAWSSHKRRVNAAKRYINVELSDLSLFAYPGERDLVVATFVQAYRSSNFNSTSRKRQYWQREADGQWRIIYEGPGVWRDR